MKNDRHAHMLSGKEAVKNYKEDLIMIKSFFREYLIWLKIIKNHFNDLS